MSESAKYPASTQAARRQASSNYYYRNREACRERARVAAAKRRAEKKLKVIADTPSSKDEAGSSAHVPPRLRHTAQNESLKAAREQATRAKYDQFMKSHYVLDYALAERSLGFVAPFYWHLRQIGLIFHALRNFEVAAEIVDEWNIAHHLLHEE
ncbi:hypothetical protein FPV67DRAFT_1449807 [Lyophyllum atratum]|nr:hypothetical protein FPV67DRAFT_1450936 [Lyophyllum atratum]KAF8066633.1 hypothetical protein FPV67DRAFT_1449807 [Lyophyllum atratum]